MKIHNPNTVAAPGGPYSHGIETPPNARWLHIAGQIGVAPEDFDGQADQCWRNIKAILAAAGMGVENLVKVTHFLTRAEDIAAYGRVRSRPSRRATAGLDTPRHQRPRAAGASRRGRGDRRHGLVPWRATTLCCAAAVYSTAPVPPPSAPM